MKLKLVDRAAAIYVHESMNGDSFRLMQQVEVGSEKMILWMFAAWTLDLCQALLLKSQVSTAQDHLLHVPCNTYANVTDATSQVLHACTQPAMFSI